MKPTGIRGPTAKSASHVLKLQSKALEDVGSGSDAHGRWLFSTALEEPSNYTTLLGSHSRFLSPGIALISHPVVVPGVSHPEPAVEVAAVGGAPRVASIGVSSSSSVIPGPFKPWSVGSIAAVASVLPLLVSPNAPPQPVLLPLTAAAAAPSTTAAQSGQRVVTLSWQLPGAPTHHSSISPTFYKLYLAADPLFNELLRQPASAAFKPDIPASGRSVDVEINGQHATTQVYALLMACNAAACSRSCIGHYTLP